MSARPEAKKNAQADDELRKCPVCEVYFKPSEGFTCPKCKRGPMCKNHRAQGKRECKSCWVESIRKELRELAAQEKSLSGFLRFLQFMFMVFAVLFVAVRTGTVEILDFLAGGIIMEGLGYLGGLSVLGYVIFYFILYNQRGKIRELEALISKTEIRRRQESYL